MKDRLKQWLKPAVRLINRLEYGYKLALVGLVFFIPTLVLAIVLSINTIADLSRSFKEEKALDVLPLIDDLQKVMDDFVDYQMILSIKQSDLKSKSALEESIKQVETRIQALVSIHISGDSDNVWGTQTQNILQSFHELSGKTITTMANPKEMYTLYNPLVVQVQSLYGTLSNLSGLINDSELEPFYLGKIVTDLIPNIKKLVNKGRAYSRFAIAQGNPTSLTYDALDGMVDELYNQGALMEQSLNYALAQTREAKSILSPKAALSVKALNNMSELMLSQLIEAIEVEMTDSAFVQEVETIQGPILDLSKSTWETLKQRLNNRIWHQFISQTILMVFMIILIGLAVYLSLALNMSVRLTIQKLSDVARAMAEGDTTVRAKLKTQDEMILLQDAFNSMSDKVNHLLHEVKDTATEVADQAKTVESIAEEGVSSVREQMTNIDLVTGSVNDLGDSVQNVFQNTAAVAKAADDALRLSEDGRLKIIQSAESIQFLNDELQLSVEITNNLSDQSQSISTILDVIKEIAAQTNLLSLNAAIEAARAGEHGRGFAVVAEEIRELAKQTEKATYEIENSIKTLQDGVSKAVDNMQSSHNKVEKTVEESHKVNEAFKQITQAVDLIHQRNSENEQATLDQKRVSSEIEEKVKRINVSAQENSKGSSQTASASQIMVELAAKLDKLVGTFKV